VPLFDSPYVAHELTTKEITCLVDAYRRSAKNLADASYDGIEISATHGVLLEMFLSPYWNHRSDHYGGTLDNRMRLLVEVLQAAREGAGPNLAIGIRFNCDEMIPDGLTQTDNREILSRLTTRKLVDFVDLDIAVEPNQLPLGMPSYLFDPLLYEPYVTAVRASAQNTPVLSVLSRITTLAEAERALTGGVVDMVGAARALIAEPDLVRNARDGQEDRSRTCIACDYCVGEMTKRSGAFGCAINPATGNERDWGTRSAPAPARRRNVVIIGGGPAGLESARVAANRGHDVTLFEQREQLGGQITLWARLPHRDSLNAAIEWLTREISRLGVHINIGVHASPDLVLEQHPDAVIVATGSTFTATGASGFTNTPIPGANNTNVFTPEQILENGARPKGNVLILDDEASNTGAGIAELLATDGANVKLVTRHLQPFTNTYVFESDPIIRRLKAHRVAIETGTHLKAIGDKTVTLYDVITNDTRELSSIDAVVLVTTRRPNCDLIRDLDGVIPQVFPIGDALGPRGIAAAFYEGQKFARLIGTPNAPNCFAHAYFESSDNESHRTPASATIP
jgi:thioredoxin reductase